MTQSLRNVLVIGLDRALNERVEPLLRRASFDVDRVPHGTSAIALVEAVSFDIVIIAYPLADLSTAEVLRAVRREGGPCARSAVIVFAPPGELPSAEAAFGSDEQVEILSTEASAEELQRQVSTVLRVAPRLSVRIPIRLEVELADSRKVVLSQTENVSAGGMLVRARRRYPVGADLHFELFIPDETSAVSGDGIVVHRTSGTEVEGIGVKFGCFDGDGQARLTSFIERRVGRR